MKGIAMTLSEFESSLETKEPPSSLHLALQALWWDAKGDWDKAHQCAQADEGDSSCDWVHAYLHRKEGDASNAGYWYRRVGKPMAETPLPDEWRAIAKALTS
ncbi:hypothetical protein [Dongia deserti]|uniref:hypothetical protein n=1 Tax=Dongia deserti TaxID=2268030 RepID=UPI002546BC16|nr:hypothetical protein [Dongia deserti]